MDKYGKLSRNYPVTPSYLEQCLNNHDFDVTATTLLSGNVAMVQDKIHEFEEFCKGRHKHIEDLAKSRNVNIASYFHFHIFVLDVPAYMHTIMSQQHIMFYYNLLTLLSKIP